VTLKLQISCQSVEVLKDFLGYKGSGLQASSSSQLIMEHLIGLIESGIHRFIAKLPAAG
jgi:hypothetical protein